MFSELRYGMQVIIKIAAGNGVGKILVGKWVLFSGSSFLLKLHLKYSSYIFDSVTEDIVIVKSWSSD